MSTGSGLQREVQKDKDRGPHRNEVKKAGQAVHGQKREGVVRSTFERKSVHSPLNHRLVLFADVFAGVNLVCRALRASA